MKKKVAVKLVVFGRFSVSKYSINNLPVETHGVRLVADRDLVLRGIYGNILIE